MEVKCITLLLLITFKLQFEHNKEDEDDHDFKYFIIKLGNLLRSFPSWWAHGNLHGSFL
jgi:hypothetical protein